MSETALDRGGPIVRRMLVGARLRRLRIEQGLSREQAADTIRASAWKIHRLENGQTGFKDQDIVDLLALYGVTDPGEVAEFVVLAREATELVCGMNRAYLGGVLDGIGASGLHARLDPAPGRCCVRLEPRRP